MSVNALYIHADLNLTFCGGDSQDSVELNICATLAKYLLGYVDNRGIFLPNKNEFNLSEFLIKSLDAFFNKEKLVTYKHYLSYTCKLDKKEGEVKTRQIVQTFPFLKEEYDLLKNKIQNSFLLSSAKKLILKLKKYHLKKILLFYVFERLETISNY